MRGVSAVRSAMRGGNSLPALEQHLISGQPCGAGVVPPSRCISTCQLALNAVSRTMAPKPSFFLARAPGKVASPYAYPYAHSADRRLRPLHGEPQLDGPFHLPARNRRRPARFPISLKLALTSYLLSLAVFVPISGWVADKYGARTVFMGAIAVFTGGSALCSLAQNLPDLYSTVSSRAWAAP